MKNIPLHETLSIDISDFAMPNDYGVGRIGKRVIFVPGAVPGDRVRVSIAREGKGFLYGKVLGIEQPSPWRRNAECPHFGSCGGCSLLHFDYSAQLETKKRHLVQALRRVGGLDVDPEAISPVTPSVDPFYYRGKIELACGGKGGRKTLVGMKKRVSPLEQYRDEVVPVDSCRIFSPLLDRILPAVRGWIEQIDVSGSNNGTGSTGLRGITVRESKSSGHAMVVAETSKDQPHEGGSLVEALETIGAVKTVCSLGRSHSEVLAGPGWIEEAVGDLRFRIGPSVFFQPNPKTAQLLYREVVDFARSIDVRAAVGLYCGMGTMEMVLSRFIESVEGYDSAPDNIEAARDNCRINEIENCRFHARKVEDLIYGSGRPDMAVVDPPRTGMSRAALNSLLNLDTPALAYVSCDPATLARDLKTITASGYRVLKVRPFDFFPHTSHLETLVLLQK